MKSLMAIVATVMLAACVHQPQPPSRNPAAFMPGAEPIPSKPSLERF